MKTILYQPLFINPQAYFVFPQLYHIERGDSYIEPANITGQLVINVLTKDLTSTPTLNVVQDTNQVDFGLFKGKHIRISQYTNIGAVVLGEWYIPGTPTPPEPEQPDWFKESIVAWYSPYCKQRMTNFDVIEAYIQDFTVWQKHDGKVIVSNNKAIVKANTPFSGNWIISNNKKFEIGKIKVTGLDSNIGNNFLSYSYYNKDGNRIIIRIKKDGIYEFPNNEYDAEAGFHCNSSLTFSNDIIIEQLPTSILKDYSGNRHDAYLYGFKGRLNSGVGIYKIDFSKTLNLSAFDNFERLNNKVIAKGNYSGNWNVFGEYDINGIVKNKVTIKITGLNNIKEKLSLEYGYYTTDSKYIKNIILIDKDGIYTYDLNDIIIPDESNIAHTIYNRMYFGERIINDINLIVEEIPDYSNQLCYDGKSYGVAYDMPILTDYTVMAERTILDNSDIADWAFIAKRDYPAINGAFTFEKDIDDTSDNLRTISFGRTSVIYNPIKERSISYQTKNKYNGQDIIVGNVDDVDFLLIGAGILDTNLNLVKEKMRVAHGNILLFNRSLTEYEISWVKNNMMCSKPQEPDIDL